MGRSWQCRKMGDQSWGQMEILRRGLRAWLIECFWLIILFIRIVSSDFVVHFLPICRSWPGGNGVWLAELLGGKRRIPLL